MERCYFCTTPFAPYGSATGYGMYNAGTVSDPVKVCYACCAWLDVIDMMQGNPIALYHADEPIDDGQRTWHSLSNWPGSLRLKVTAMRHGRHNMAGKRTTYYFDGPCGSKWSGVEYHGVCSGNLLRQVRRLAS